MAETISLLNDLLWGSILVYILAGVGIYFTVKLDFIQFRHFTHLFSVLRNSRRFEGEGISSFQALCTSLAARVGTGNMAGVAIALTAGGPGAIFWMWLIAMFGMATSFAESTLAQLYKIKDDNGQFRGGPAYYMHKGLGMRWLGALFSVLLIITFGLVFNAVQANAIVHAMETAFGWDSLYVGVFVVLLAAFIIFGGIRTVAKTAEIIVPVMALAYLLLASVVIIFNLDKVPGALGLIFKSAFGVQEAIAGGVGYSISQAVINGAERGLFSNEAGMGSAPNAAATATPYPPHPVSQGYVQMLGVFLDTIVICTATVAIILLSGEYQQGGPVTGIELTQNALSSQVGDWGSIFVAIAIFFFAFTSIIANYSYAETNLTFLKRDQKINKIILRILVLVMVLYGAMDSLPTIWALAGLSMGLMSMVNLMTIMLLSSIVIKLAKDYNRQINMGRVPKFKSNEYPELIAQLEKEVWRD
ncbi:sodium:alanine symporter family protein [Vibrio sp. TH_r3]|uniref:alanine/glycine:cation symporter family protein n=1 Tax=Vibrio sp. TH_r3 TaxID=3082084 RepID=UPI002955A37F|nr:sodium:alanine symporter family protein [Vibrio sp. TH_r3]MDV7105213.1 sodium:alanine symporter family protein [Vibrio sp. TH_r3]